MTKQYTYRNKYVISPENHETLDNSNTYEIIHVVQRNSSTEDIPLDVRDNLSMIPQRSYRQDPFSEADHQDDPPGIPPTTVSVPDRSKRRSVSESSNNEEQAIPPPTKETDEDKSLEKEKDIQIFAHSRLWTCLAILCSWIGFTLALLARNSTEFVSIKIPMYFDPNYNTVTTIGMVNLELCYNTTFVSGYEGCVIDRLGSEEVSDTKYQLARSFSTLVVWLGGFAAVMITSSIFWYSINLRPLGFCFLISYFLESFSFIFLDSEVCKNHGCSVDTGGYLAIVASGFWMLASVSASRMDAFKYQQAARKNRQHLRMLRRKARMEQMKMTSNVTESTNISLTDSDSWENASSDNSSDDSEPGVFNRTMVSSLVTTTDAVETTFVGFDNHKSDIEEGRQVTPQEPSDQRTRDLERQSRKAKRVQLVDHHEKNPKTTRSKSRSRVHVDDQAAERPQTGSARTVDRFRLKLVRHQTC